jgi:hypothetical protein
MPLTFREAALFSLDQSRKVLGPGAGGIDLREDSVTVRVRTWTSGVLRKPPVSGAAYTDANLALPLWTNVAQVSTNRIAQSGGIYEVGDLRVGPITPSYPSPLPGVAAGGLTPQQIAPKVTTPGVEVFYVVTGAHGGEYTLIRAETAHPLHYFLNIRRRLTTPYAPTP